MPMQNEYPVPETAPARAARHLAMLAELGDLTLRILRRTAAEVLVEPLPAPHATEPRQAAPRRAAPAPLFDRLAKSLRETIALENRVAAAPATQPDQRQPPAPEPAPPKPDHAVPSYLRKPPADPKSPDDLSLISQRFTDKSRR